MTPEELPAGISVSPAQGIVDISGSADVRGVTEITFTFPSIPEVNADASGNFCIYVNGSETPAEELPAAGNAAVDPMGMPMGGFTFKHVYKDAGTYRITVPAGVWKYGESANPAMTLNYEILPGVVSYPAEGVVAELMEISLTVPGVDRLNVDAEKIMFFTMARDIEFNAVADGNEVFITPKNLDDVNAYDTYYLNLGQGSHYMERRRDRYVVLREPLHICQDGYPQACHLSCRRGCGCFRRIYRHFPRGIHAQLYRRYVMELPLSL